MFRNIIAKRFAFEAAHSLPNHDGECRGLHGHSYKVIVEVQGLVRPQDGSASEGMVIDFRHLKAAYKKRIHSRCDHKYLNDSLPELGGLPTAERLAWWMLVELSKELDNTPTLVRAVTVYETETSFARCERIGWA